MVNPDPGSLNEIEVQCNSGLSINITQLQASSLPKCEVDNAYELPSNENLVTKVCGINEYELIQEDDNHYVFPCTETKYIELVQ